MGYKKFGIVLINALLIVSLLLSSVSCSKREDNSDIEVTDEKSSYYYSSKVVDIHIDGQCTSIYNVIPYNDYYYAIVQSIAIDLSSADKYLYCIDSDGQVISSMKINKDLNIYVSSDIINDELIYVTFANTVEKMNITTGEVTYSSYAGLDLCGVVACDDGYVVMSIGKVDKYDKDNTLVSTIENPDWKFFNGYKTFYESNGNYYLLPDSGFKWKYYKLDFERLTSELIYDPYQSESQVISCHGMYLFDEDGEYLMDFENARKMPLAKWNGMDLQPPQYCNVDPQYIGVDGDTFLQTYNYDNLASQLIIYSYEPDVNYSDRKVIVLGGYECSLDKALNWAIYKFNTSQDEYRIVIEDYSVDFGFESLESAPAQKAALIQYFNQGNAPDIFYGKQFDYKMLAKNGDLLDITQYMSDNFKNNLDEITPSVRDLMLDEEGRCYSVFSGYQIVGYLSSLNIDTDLSIDEAIKCTNEYGVTLNNGEVSSQIVLDALQFSILDGELCSVEELKQILEYAYENGFSDINHVTYTSMDNVTVNDYLLWYGWVYTVVAMDDREKSCNERLDYVGYPTIDGSKHVILPYGQVGVSSATSYPEACVEFMSYLIADDVQDFCNLSSVIPVNDLYVQKMINYSEDHSIIPDEEYQYYVYLYTEDEVSNEAITDFYSAIESVDTVQHYDWGVESIICEEVQAYYTENKPIDEIAESLHSRLNLYLAEN